MLRGPDPFAADAKELWRTDARRNGRRRSSVTIRHGRSIPSASPRAASSTPISAPSATSGPVNDPKFDAQFPEKSFWSRTIGEHGSRQAAVLDPVQKNVKAHGNGSRAGQRAGAANRSAARFPQHAARADLAKWWGCSRPVQPTSSTDMPFSLALMVTVDLVSRKWMDDQHVTIEAAREALGRAQELPQSRAKGPHYRARPLNGVWATAPYLHNGSVPSLYWLLTPQPSVRRSSAWARATLIRSMVGFRVDGEETEVARRDKPCSRRPDHNGSEINGNSVAGHSFEGGRARYPDGVVGRAQEG